MSLFRRRGAAAVSSGAIDWSKVAEDMQNLKSRDLELALNIAGFAGQPTRDPRGNVLSSVWAKVNTNSQVGLLLERNDVRALLLKQLESQIRDRKALIDELDSNDVVCKWILNFTQSWETAYTNMAQADFDVSQQVLSAMHETYFLVEPFLERHAPYEQLCPKNLRVRLGHIQDEFEQSEYRTKIKLHGGTDAYTRVLFRSPLGLDLCRIAGKLLQKAEVCNRSGAYSSRVQRNDIQREVEHALDHVCRLLLEDEAVLKETADRLASEQQLAVWTIDHRGFPKPGGLNSTNINS